MTIKKITKVTKANKAPAFDAKALCTQLGKAWAEAHSLAAQAAVSLESALAIVADLRKAKLTIGDVRKCPLAQAIKAGFSHLAVGTQNNYLSEIRKAVNDGEKLSLNSSRAKAEKGGKDAKGKSKGAKAGGSGNILISINKAATPDKAAESLLKGFNSMKEANDALAGLAAFLIDALEDAKTKKYNPLAK